MAGFLSSLIQLIGTGGGAALGTAAGDPMAGMAIGNQLSQLVPVGKPPTPMGAPALPQRGAVTPPTISPPVATAAAPGMAGPSASPSMQQLIELMQKMRGTAGGSPLG